jgi:sugar transferase (PEP-CTERM system associated)
MNKHLIVVLGDILIAFLAVGAGSLLRFGELGTFSGMHVQRLFIFISVTVFVSYLAELYNFEKNSRKREIALRVMLGLIGSFISLTTVHYLMHVPMFFRGMSLSTLSAFGLMQFLWHVGSQALFSSEQLARKVIVLGTGPLAKKIGDLVQTTNHQHVLSGYLKFGSDPVTVPVHTIVSNGGGLIDTIKKEKAHKLVVSLSERRGSFPLKDVLACKFCGIDVVDAPSFYEELTGKLLIENITPSWFIFSNGFRMNTTINFYKRLLDIMGAVLGILLTLAFFPFIALLIKLDSPGPIFFKQIRVGEMEQEFLLYKFRTMRQDAELGTGAVWAQKNDPRITRLGSFLRKSRIDELPQLYNVLKGEMSFIGPRPERPEFVGKLKEVVPFYSERHFVKPGITGWAQIKYPYGASEKDALEKLRYDLYYIKNMSIFLELSITIETIKVMLFGRGAR